MRENVDAVAAWQTSFTEHVQETLPVTRHLPLKLWAMDETRLCPAHRRNAPCYHPSEPMDTSTKRATILRWMLDSAILVLIAIMLTVVMRHTDSSTDAFLFGMVMLVYPAVQLILRRSVLAATWTIGLWLAFYGAYVDYQNRPWFATAPLEGCDGPCFGWYSFENQPLTEWLILIGICSLLIGTLIRNLVVYLCRSRLLRR